MSDHRFTNRPPAIIWQWAVLADERCRTCLATAWALALSANLDGTNVRPGIANISEWTGVTTRTVERHLAALRKLGYLVVVKRGGGYKARRSATVYSLALPAGHPGIAGPSSPDTQVSAQGTLSRHSGVGSNLHPTPSRPSPDNWVSGALDLHPTNSAPSNDTQVSDYRLTVNKSPLVGTGTDRATDAPDAGDECGPDWSGFLLDELDPDRSRCPMHPDAPRHEPSCRPCRMAVIEAGRRADDTRIRASLIAALSARADAPEVENPVVLDLDAARARRAARNAATDAPNSPGEARTAPERHTDTPEGSKCPQNGTQPHFGPATHAPAEGEHTQPTRAGDNESGSASWNGGA